jgi:IS30 family transposase
MGYGGRARQSVCQYFPKGTDLIGYSQSDLDAVALQLNTRPRKTLGFMTTAAKFAGPVASTN